MSRHPVTGASRPEREVRANAAAKRAEWLIRETTIDWYVDPPELVFTPDLSTDEQVILSGILGNPTATGVIGVVSTTGGGPHLHSEYADTGHTHPGAAHPDVTAHVTLGLAPAHGHDFAATGHNHDAAYSFFGHSHAHNHDGSYAPPSHAHVDGDLPAGLARDAEVAATYALIHGHPYEASGAVAAHEALADAHPGYLTPAEGNAAYALTGHTHAGGSSPWTLVAKTADESKNNLATVADDNALVFTTLPNTQYAIRLRAFWLTNATADLKYRLVHTGTTTRVRRRVHRTATTDIAQTIEFKTAFDAADVILATTGLNPWLEEHVVLQVGTSGGAFKLQWSQGTSNAGPTTCLEGSYLEYALS